MQNANLKLLEKLRLPVGPDPSFVGLHFPSVRTLKDLDLTLSLYSVPQPLAGLCEELEAMAGHNMLEALSLEVGIDGHETGHHRIYNPTCGEGTGQTWVVCVKTGFL